MNLEIPPADITVSEYELAVREKQMQVLRAMAATGGKTAFMSRLKGKSMVRILLDEMQYMQPPVMRRSIVALAAHALCDQIYRDARRAEALAAGSRG